MTPAQEVGAALYGALRLAMLDRGALGFFNASWLGFWRSFIAAVIYLPAYGVITAFSFVEEPSGSAPAVVALVELIAYVARWATLPLLMIYVAEALDRSDNYFRFMVAYHWASIPVALASLAWIGLAQAGLLPDPLGLLTGIALQLAVLGYGWFIARLALGAGPLAAAIPVVLDLLLNAVIDRIVDVILLTSP